MVEGNRAHHLSMVLYLGKILIVFLSKLTERIVRKRIDSHIEANNLHDKKAFGYKTGHSTETMMLGVTSDVLNGFDQNKCTVMLFLDLSAAFDTIDIDKLQEILLDEIEFNGKALDGANHSSPTALKG